MFSGPAFRAGSATAFAAVGAGGVAGGLARYGFLCAFPEDAHSIPWTTMIINVAGAFLLGILVFGIAARVSSARWIRPLLGTGFLGAFTTFSAYAWAIDERLRSALPSQAVIILAGSVLLGLVAAWLGSVLGCRWAEEAAPPQARSRS